MAQRAKKLEEIISIHGEVDGVVSYADYFTRRPLFTSLKVRNDGDETLGDLLLTIEGTNGVLIPFQRFLEIPFESAVEITLGEILSPLYFANAEETRQETITATLTKNGKTIATKQWTVTTLPFDYWEGGQGDAELLATFVRPRLGNCAKVQSDVLAQLKKWNTTCELGGYLGNDKNTIRNIVAALYASLRKHSIKRKPCDISRPVEAGAGVKMLTDCVASPLELALFACSCLESMGLHAVLIYGDKEITCGVWLYDSCFLDTVSDDISRVETYISEGINNLSFFDIEDVYSDKNAAYSTSESHFKQKLSSGLYDKYVDVKRCRISKISPLPLRARNLKGYEVLTEEDMSPDQAPTKLMEMKNLSVEEMTKNKQWERRLLDLSLKNPLLHFNPNKLAVQLLSSSPDDVLDALTENEEMLFAPANPEAHAIAANKIYFGANAEAKRMRELIQLENRSGILRT